ncbi:hypothetical protein B0H11DRAFT_1922348 [Mycena galericulata]|nr:hypothetical protein B0H11DRAFT_1922348 [Mycena galericulata]
MQIRKWMPLGRGRRTSQGAERTPSATTGEVNSNGDLLYRQGSVVWRAKAGRLIVVHPKRRQKHERWSDSVDEATSSQRRWELISNADQKVDASWKGPTYLARSRTYTFRDDRGGRLGERETTGHPG